jgi:O-antigen ligase
MTIADMKNAAEKARNTKSTRIWFMVAIAVILFVLWWMGKIKTSIAVGLGIIVLAAIGIETMNYDLDLGSILSGKSVQESRVTHTKDGLKLMGSCALPTK